eukprot:403335149
MNSELHKMLESYSKLASQPFIVDDDDDDDDDDNENYDDQFVNSKHDLMPELTNQTILNYYMQDDKISIEDKIMLIYEKILEELIESQEKHKMYQEQDNLLNQYDETKKQINDKIQLEAQKKQQLECDLRSLFLRQLQQKSDIQNLRQREQDSVFMITQEDVNNAAKRDKPEELGPQLQDLTHRIKAKRIMKERELQELKNAIETKKAQHAPENIEQLQKEVAHYRERADLEEKNLHCRREDLIQFEKKASIMGNALELEEKKYLEGLGTLEKEKDKLQRHVKDRYWQLTIVEDSSNDMETMMSEKQELLRKKRELKDQMIHLEDKEKEIKAKISGTIDNSQNNSSAGAGKKGKSKK